MRVMMSLGLTLSMVVPVVPVSAATQKEQDCAYQGEVVEAVRQARIARVKERQVAEHIAGTNPTWPERYNTAIPLVTPWVYEMKRRDVKSKDLASGWIELCLQQ